MSFQCTFSRSPRCTEVALSPGSFAAFQLHAVVLLGGEGMRPAQELIVNIASLFPGFFLAFVTLSKTVCNKSWEGWEGCYCIVYVAMLQYLCQPHDMHAIVHIYIIAKHSEAMQGLVIKT